LPLSLALMAGVALAYRALPLPLPALAAVMLLAAALRSRWGAVVAAAALGALLVQLDGALPASAGESLAGRAVTVTGRVSEPWRRASPFAEQTGWRAPLAVEGLWDRRAPRRAPAELWLSLPGEAPPPAYGSRLRVRGRLQRAAAYANGGASQPGPWRLVCPSRELVAIVAPPSRLDRWSQRWRRAVETALDGDATGSEDDAREEPGEGDGTALARALLLGDPSHLPERWVRGLRRSGLGHLLAVSGLHVGLMASLGWLVGWLFGRLFWGLLPARRALRRGVPVATALAFIAGYLLLLGPRPSALRAATMASLALAASLLQRPAAAANGLACAAALLVIGEPRLVGDLGFQLTVSATLGIVVLAGPLARRWQGLAPRWTPGWLRHAWLARALAASVAAQVAVLPWSAPAFHQVHPVAPLLNLLAIPWTALALAASSLWLAGALISPPLGTALARVLDLLAIPFGWPASGQGSGLCVPVAWSSGEALLVAILLLAAAWWPRRAAAAASVLAVVLLAAAVLLPAGAPALELVVLDVGQGDAILLRDGDRALLVDGGGWRQGDFGGRVLLPALTRLGVRRLAAVAMTHPDRDHCGGLADLAGRLPIDELWSAPGWPARDCVTTLYNLRGVRLRPLWAGEEAALGRWRLRILHPPPQPQRRRSGEDNDRSLVMLAEAAGFSALLTGDIGARAERRWRPPWSEGHRLDLLKVAHHGSKSSTSEPFLRRFRPRLAVVSAGLHNRYGHPAPEVLDRLRRQEALVLRTDQQGQIRIAISDDGVWRASWAGRDGDLSDAR
jgi:competence protein ComEC